MKALIITIVVVLSVGYGIYYLSWIAEPNKMTRDCTSSHTESYTSMQYNAALKMSLPTNQTKTVCDTYGDWYVSPAWIAWDERQKEKS
jgi:hypothetical protein